MLNQTLLSRSRDPDNIMPLSPPSSPPQSPTPTHETLDKGPRLNILQLNCFNKHNTLQELLQLSNIDILLLQEPWTNPFTYTATSN